MEHPLLGQFARSVGFIFTVVFLGLPFAVLMPNQPWLVLLIALTLTVMLRHRHKRT